MTTNPTATTHDSDSHGRHLRDELRFYQVRLSDRDAWFSAAVAALFNTLGMLLEIEISRRNPGMSVKLPALSALVGLLLLLVLFIWRRTPSVRWATIIYSINTASIITVLGLTNLRMATAEAHWVPFQASKLGCLIAAMLAPGFWVGLLSILAFSISAVIQFEFFFPPELQARAAPEPWPIIAFALGGILALAYRFRRAQLEQEVARIQAQNFAIRRLANAFMNIRDLMNTPLQVIEFSVDLLRTSKEPSKPIIDRIDRSLQSLREINSVLVQHEKEIEWETRR